MSDMGQLVKEFGLPIALSIIFALGSLALIKYLLVQTKELGGRIGVLEGEYRNDLKAMLKNTTEALDRSSDCQREVAEVLKECRRNSQRQ